MTKRLVDIDDELLEGARAALGARTMKEAVNLALREVVAAELRRRHLARLVSSEGIDLADDEVMADAWR